VHRFSVLLGVVGCVSCGRPGQGAVQAVSAQSPVRPGIDVLLTDSLQLVRNRTVGLVTNQTGVDAEGVSDITRLRSAGIELLALFSPEHGFRGAADPGAAVASSKDSATGLPIYSLYGRTSAPTDEMMRGIDVMIVDLQDAGARYYTYLATTVEVMRAAGRRGIPVIVLDRPNPIGGLVQGNVLDPAFSSPVGLIAVPMRHGMTLGELARVAQSDLAISVSLTVVPIDGWRRMVFLDQTSLPFIAPSPNLRSVESLFHYPGLCLFEGTNLSVGRGSERPFEQIGAPWLDTVHVLAQMRRARLPGVELQSVRFTPVNPGDGKFSDTTVAGIQLRVIDRRRYDPAATAVYLLAAIQRLQPDSLRWIPAHFDRLAGGTDLRVALQAGTSPRDILSRWQKGLDQFRTRRARFLLYPAEGLD
jgi:uncharacterized protein YbbC (DUF1343 family)